MVDNVFQTQGRTWIHSRTSTTAPNQFNTHQRLEQEEHEHEFLFNFNQGRAQEHKYSQGLVDGHFVVIYYIFVIK